MRFKARLRRAIPFFLVIDSEFRAWFMPVPSRPIFLASAARFYATSRPAKSVRTAVVDSRAISAPVFYAFCRLADPKIAYI